MPIFYEKKHYFGPLENSFNAPNSFLTRKKSAEMYKLNSPNSYALREFLKYEKNAYLVNKIFSNVVFMFLAPFTKVLDLIYNMIDFPPFSWKLAVIKGVERAGYLTVMLITATNISIIHNMSFDHVYAQLNVIMTCFSITLLSGFVL